MRSAFVAVGLLLAATLSAHTVDPREVVDYLNAKETRQAYGIDHAQRLAARSDLLVIAINAGWFRLPTERRQELAREWLDLWRHSVRTGRVSIVDTQTRAPVVHYLPDGSARVAGPRP